MPSEPTAAVLFDLDGTLIATRRLYLECYRKALAPHLGHLPDDAELMEMGPRAELRFLPGLVPEGSGPDCLDAFYEHYRALHEELFEGVYTGVPAMLETLRATDARLGIITGKSRRSWEITAAHVELGPFDVFICDDDVDAPKPDPEGVRRALEALDAPAEDTFYIGDSIGDLEAARAAEARPGAVLWSKRLDERDSFAARAREIGATLFVEPGDVTRAILGRGDGAARRAG